MRSSVVIPSTTTAVSGAPLPKMNKEDGWNRFADIGRAVLIGGSVIGPLWRRDFRWGFNALTAVFAASAVSKGTKAFWNEPRPNGQDNNSFPSLHSADCFAAATVLNRRWPNGIGPAAIGLATAVALARIFGGKHHLADTVAGASVGIFVGELASGYRSPLPDPER